ncbi:MAG: hypothetical protein Kow0073_09650 [Immundisolibacter sp.]
MNWRGSSVPEGRVSGVSMPGRGFMAQILGWMVGTGRSVVRQPIIDATAAANKGQTPWSTITRSR